MKKRSWRRFATIGMLLLGLFALAQFFPYRIDLTEEKRYSLNPATIAFLEDLEEPVTVELLLTGEALPPGMKRLQRAIREMVQTFDVYSPVKISVRELNPLNLPKEEQEEFIVGLSEFGINPTNVFTGNELGQRTQLLFPGVLLRTREFETGRLLLRGLRDMPAEQILQTSIENLEYELLRGLKDLVQEGGATIGMLMSRGEMAEDEGFGLVEALSEEFEVFKVPLEQANRVEDLDPFDVLLIMGPKEAYTERERYFLDQYLMRGGHLVFALDALAFDPDALSAPEGTIAMPFDHGFDQMLFRYGVRINKDLVQDLNFGLLPVYGGNFGNQEQLVPLPWPFYVRVTQLAKHPVTKGLDPLLVRYVSSLDTVKAEGVRKTPLLFSSSYSFREAAPVRLALSDAERAPDVERFQAGSLPLMYLLEGEFTSFYKNRFLPEGVDAAGFLEQGSRGRVLVTGSGSWFKSQRIGEGQAPLALGQSPLQVEDYDNRRFVQHLMQYLLEPEGMIASRAKEFRVRPLDKVRVQEERRYWQGVNVLLPPLLMVLLGLGLVQLRRMRYARR